MLITDPRYPNQLHFDPIGDIEAIWADYSGDGVSVAVYDDGMDQTHADLAANYDASLHFNGAFPDDGRHDGYNDDGHGTAVAGIIAAALNGLGGVGVAWGARLTSVNFLGDAQNQSAATQIDMLEHGAVFDIVNQSYGTMPDYTSDIGDPFTFSWDEAQAFAEGAASGRAGLGTIYVKSAGNDANNARLSSDFGVYGNAQGEGHNSLHTVITVAATDFAGSVEDYSNYGHNLLISAPAAANTTDITGRAGYSSGNYANDFSGTSAAAPVISGVVALMLEANPNLGFRDVQNILAASAAQTGSAFGSPAAGFEVEAWSSIGGGTWNGGAMTFNQSYGYGMVDAFAAVRMAEVWSGIHGAPATADTLVTQTVETSVSALISHTQPVIATMTVTEGVMIEHAYVTFDGRHSYASDLTVDLIAPDGTVVNLFLRELGDFSISEDYTFGVASLRGMSSEGTWTLRVTDAFVTDYGTLDSVEIQFLGSPLTTDDVWTVTQDFQALASVEPARRAFDDTNGGADWLNMVAVTGDALVNLGSNGADGAVRVDDVLWSTLTGGAIENAMTGDGDDVLRGNAGDNSLYAGRGSNVVHGMGGSDTLFGLNGRNLLIGEDRGLYGTELSAQVYRLFNAVFGREPNWNGHQNWALNLASDAWTLDSISAAFVASPEFQLTYGALSNTDFVTLLFRNVLGREPAEAGVTGWVGNIEGGMTREEVVRRISESAEHTILTRAALDAFEDARDPTEWVDDVFRLFRAIFDRDPGEAGFTGWIANLANGVSDFETTVRQFMDSPEFQANYGATTNAEFVTLLFRNVLKREPNEAGLQGWENNLANGMSREQVVTLFMASQEFLNATEPALKAYIESYGADDVLTSVNGDGVLSGGLYQDTFVFTRPEDGTSAQVVTDLEPWDLINLSGFGYAGANEALSHFRQQDGDTVFSDQNMTVAFLETELTAITQDMLQIL